MALVLEEELQELCDEHWLSIDQEVAEDLKLPTWETPEDYRKRITEAFCSVPEIRKYDPRKPAHRRVLAQRFRHHAFAKARTYAEAAIHAAVLIPPRKLAQLRRRFRVKDLPKAEAGRPARLRKADALNLELLSFVVERIIPFGQLLKARPDIHGKDTRLLPGHRGPKVAVPREFLLAEWNRTHPHDQMSSGDVLMIQFYRAVGRPHLRSTFLREVESEIGEVWYEHESALTRIREYYASLSEEKLAELAAPLPRYELSAQQKAESRRLLRNLRAATARLKASFPTPEEYEEWRARRDAEREEDWRASLTRKELIERRAMPLVWHHQATEDRLQLWDSPLREWFLPEAQGERMRLHWFSWGGRRERKRRGEAEQ